LPPITIGIRPRSLHMIDVVMTRAAPGELLDREARVEHRQPDTAVRLGMQVETSPSSQAFAMIAPRELRGPGRDGPRPARSRLARIAGPSPAVRAARR
jgi:hypothetical protein